MAAKNGSDISSLAVLWFKLKGVSSMKNSFGL